MKYITQSVLLAIVAWSASIGFASANFVDVDGGTLYDDSIDYVEREDIVSGYSDNTYRPSNLITRGEFTKIIVNARYSNSEIENCIDDHNYGNIFDDVSESDEFADYICIARAKNLVSGYSNGDFRPDEYITLGEASKLLVRGFNLSGSRAELRSYAEELIERRAIPSHLRALNEYVTRGQMAEMIYRVRENNRGREALRESNLYDRIITMEFENYDSSDAEIRGRILDRLNYTVFKNNEGSRITIDVDKKTARNFLDDLDNDEEDTILVYVNDNKVKYGFIL